MNGGEERERKRESRKSTTQSFNTGAESLPKQTTNICHKDELMSHFCPTRCCKRHKHVVAERTTIIIQPARHCLAVIFIRTDQTVCLAEFQRNLARLLNQQKTNDKEEFL